MDVTIVIQGPTRFYKEILHSRIANARYVWSTWSDEPTEALNAIIDSGTHVVICEKPTNMGYGNVNAQAISSFKGLTHVTTPYAFKVRSDMLYSDMGAFLDMLKTGNKLLSFMCYHTWTGGYPVDYMCFGKTSEVIKYWDYVQQGPSNIFAERQLMDNYFKKYHPDWQNTFDFLKEHFYFFLGDMVKRGLEIVWLKNGMKLSYYAQDALFLT